MSNTILYMEAVDVKFGAFQALKNVSFLVEPGELRFLIGPNGAGKTTLLDVICGKVRPSDGRVIFQHSTDLTQLKPYEIARLGVSRKFQAPSVFGELSVDENLELALSGVHGWRGVFGVLSGKDRERIDETLELLNLKEQRSEKAGFLSHGQKQWVELGMTLIQEPALLLVDEPVAGMTETERRQTGEILQKISGSRSVIVVEHDMKFVEEYAKKISVLHDGRVICEGDFERIRNNPEVISVYLGRSDKELTNAAG